MTVHGLRIEAPLGVRRGELAAGFLEAPSGDLSELVDFGDRARLRLRECLQQGWFAGPGSETR